jgi:C4-type Zn-finger protein
VGETGERRECPMCGEYMVLEERTQLIPIPGTSQTVTKLTREWVCRECDHFEEEEDTAAPPAS